MPARFDLRLLTPFLIGLTIGLGYFVQQSDFQKIIAFYAIFFMLYLCIFFFTNDKKKILFFVGVGILLRFILIFSIPNLSDDIFRFVWDGRLIINGYNPFDHLPIYFIENNIAIPGIDQALFNKLNSPEYFTIYPPVAQGVFASACWFFPNNIFASSILMKIFLFACEIGSLFFIKKLLTHFALPQKNILLYALNPLIIIELCGNLHFEAAMIFFLLGAIYFLVKEKNTWSAIFIALSVASKLLPLMFFPLLIKRLGWQKSIRYFLTVGVVLVLLFAPLLNGVFFSNFGESLDLYFQKFEFNASIYYLSRWVGFQIVGYNLIQTIGPALAFIVLGSILFIAFSEPVFRKNSAWKSLPEKMLFAICIYLACATIVHPWYVSLPVALCIFTKFRFPIFWSGFVFLTYINYSYADYFENLWMVGLEYVVVFGVFVFEFFLEKKSIQIPSRLQVK